MSTTALFAMIDTATDELENAFWELLHGVAAEAKAPAADIMAYFKRSAITRLREIKPTHGIDRDDGRAALWRVRLYIHEVVDGVDRLRADTDPGPETPQALEAPGSTIMAGLPAVARWAWELISAHHAAEDPGCEIEGLSELTLQGKLRSLRVSIHHQCGACMWRSRYVLHPPASGAPVQTVPGSLRGVGRSRSLRHFRADVRISREAPALRTERA